MQEMVIHSQAKHLVREAVIGRFEPHLYQIDIPYVNVNEVFLPVLIKNHWTLYVYDLENRRIQLLDSRPGRKKTMLSGVQQNLVCLPIKISIVALINVSGQGCPVVGCPQKEVSPYDLRTFNFITPISWEYVVLKTKCTSRSCPERLKGIGGFWHPRLDKLLDERELILAPSSGVRPVDQFRSTGSRRIGQNFKIFK
ncbi:hypothetical protein AAG906_004844 [Vitis piasezkii]